MEKPFVYLDIDGDKIKIDYDLLGQLAKEDDNQPTYSKFILDDAYIFRSGEQWDSSSEGDFIIASYKNISWPDINIPLNKYLIRLKQKERDIKLNQLL
jgi:hypothetical protein